MKYKNYKIKYCDHCDTPITICPVCKNSSCNGGGCESCIKDDKETQEILKGLVRSDFQPEDILLDSFEKLFKNTD